MDSWGLQVHLAQRPRKHGLTCGDRSLQPGLPGCQAAHGSSPAGAEASGTGMASCSCLVPVPVPPCPRSVPTQLYCWCHRNTKLFQASRPWVCAALLPGSPPLCQPVAAWGLGGGVTLQGSGQPQQASSALRQTHQGLWPECPAGPPGFLTNREGDSQGALLLSGHSAGGHVCGSREACTPDGARLTACGHCPQSLGWGRRPPSSGATSCLSPHQS